MSSSIFTKIIHNELPSFKVFEDEWTFAFLTKDAIQLGHTLIIPKVEIDYFIDVPEPYYTKVFQNAKVISRAIHEVTNCKRVCTVIEGQDVPHFHYHLIPIFDYFDLDPKRARERTREENIDMQKKIVKKLETLTE